MKNLIFNFKSVLFFLFAGLFVISGCKKEYDEPPIAQLPNIKANTTIAELISSIPGSGAAVAIADDVIFSGVVISSDKEGNFYKKLIIQDSTGGIAIPIDAYEIHSKYPLGREVFVSGKGLYVAKDRDVPTISASADLSQSRLPELMMNELIIGGEYEKFVTPKVVTINSLTPADYNTLVTIENAEFDVNTVVNNGTMADAVTQQSVGHLISDCSGGSVELYNSGYSTFAGDAVPAGKGNLTCVYSNYSNPQILISSMADLDMNDPNRCTPLPAPLDFNVPVMTIANLRTLYTGNAANLTNAEKIQGKVISDVVNGNITSKNVIIQDASGAGIAVRFAANHSFNLNDEVEILLQGVELSEYKGLLQLNNVPNNQAQGAALNLVVTPRTATVDEVNTNSEAWESTLVTISTVTLAGGGTYSGSIDVTDATGTIIMYTSSFASFANDNAPSSATSVTAIVSQYNTTKQLQIRNLGDVISSGTGGGTGGGTATLVDLATVRSSYTGAASTYGAGKIKGIVISDKDNGNITSKNLIIQDATGGIVVRFTANNTFSLGDEVEIVVTGAELSEFRGLLQFNNVDIANATLVSSGNSITPAVVTTADIASNGEALESTLVQIQNATIATAGGTYSGAGTITDAQGTVDIYTSSFASFSGASVPSGTVSVTCIVSEYNARQVQIRNTTDVQ